MKYKNLSRKIIGASYQVYNTLGFGFLESVYEKSLEIELSDVGMNISRQEPITVYYSGQLVGDFIADLIINEKIIVEIKSVQTLHKRHEVQLVNYLTATNTDVGLLINFGESEVEVKRKVRELPNGQDILDWLDTKNQMKTRGWGI